MRYKTPDIKTADVFFEIFSNPKKTLEHIENMRTIRDQINASLGLEDTKAKVDKLLREASKKMEDAKRYEMEGRADLEAASSRLAMDIENHKVAMEKEHGELDTDKAAFATRSGAVTRASNAMKADLDKRSTDLVKREEEVSWREAKVTERENAANAWTKSMTEAKKAMDRVR